MTTNGPRRPPNPNDSTARPCHWGDSPLRTAIRRGRVFKALRILERDQEAHGTDPVTTLLEPDAQGHNLLHLAVRYSHPAMLAALEARAGVVVEPAAPTLSPLALAIERKVHHRRYHHRQLAMVEYLLARGETPQEGTAPEPWPNHLLNKGQFGAFDRMLTMPAAQGWRWDVPLPSDGRKALLPLSSLVLQSGPERFEKALAMGAPLLPAPGTWSAAHVAAHRGRIDELLVLLKLEPALMKHRNPDQETVVHLLVHNLLFDSGSWSQRLAGFEALLDQTTPADVNAPDARGRTPLVQVVELCLNRRSARMDRTQEVITRLVNAGAGVIGLSVNPGERSLQELIDAYDADPQQREQTAMGLWLRALYARQEGQALRAVAGAAQTPLATARPRERI